MALESTRPIYVILDGKNYSQWSYHMKKKLKGKSLWKYTMGDRSCPQISTTDLTDQIKKADWKNKVDQWEVENSKIMTWIANTVDHSISMQFSRFETAKAIWDFLSNRYNQTNFYLKYKLEMDIRNLKQQLNQSFSDFHLQMSVIWDQLALMEPKWTVDAELYEQYREETRLVQFLMALRDDFEGIRSSLFYRTPLPTIDSALGELIAEETRKGTTISPKPIEPSVFSTPPWKTKNLSQIQCHYCKEFGHLVKDCPKPSSNNMRTKQKGRTYAKQNIVVGAMQSSPASISTLEELQSLLGQTLIRRDSQAITVVQQSPRHLTADDVQNMIQQALANTGTASSTSTTPSGMQNGPCLLDSGASNYMTFDYTTLN
jgi:gag-polypeptide of LTR copia-type/Zinc knuckle